MCGSRGGRRPAPDRVQVPPPLGDACPACQTSAAPMVVQPPGSAHGCLRRKGSQRRPQKRLGRRLEEVAEAVGGGYCRLQPPLRLALAVTETVAGRRQGAPRGVPPPLSNAPLVLLPDGFSPRGQPVLPAFYRVRSPCPSTTGPPAGGYPFSVLIAARCCGAEGVMRGLGGRGGGGRGARPPSARCRLRRTRPGRRRRGGWCTTASALWSRCSRACRSCTATRRSRSVPGRPPPSPRRPLVFGLALRHGGCPSDSETGGLGPILASLGLWPNPRAPRARSETFSSRHFLKGPRNGGRFEAPKHVRGLSPPPPPPRYRIDRPLSNPPPPDTVPRGQWAVVVECGCGAIDSPCPWRALRLWRVGVSVAGPIGGGGGAKGGGAVVLGAPRRLGAEMPS